MAMSALPLSAPVILTTNSGKDVPMPTIVRPITNSLRPAFLAIVEEPSTSQSAPKNNQRKAGEQDENLSNHLLWIY